MDFSSFSIVAFVASVMITATPLLLAALGELVVEKSGVLNLGVEGMMIIGAVIGFAAAIETGNPFWGFICAAIGGALVSMVFGVLVLYFRANQVATGLALTLFGLGISSMLGQAYSELRPPATPKLDLGVVSDLPIVGRILFSHDPIVYLSLFLLIATWAVLKFSRVGLVLRAVGENHDAAHALGYKVIRIRMMAIAFGGALAGIGGAHLSLIRVAQWTDGMTAGAGWIALAIVVFASWRPIYLIIGAYLFGGVNVLQLAFQVAGVSIPIEILSASPYVATIVVLVLLSRSSKGAPGSLGKNFEISG